jgi:hypothetical protein
MMTSSPHLSVPYPSNDDNTPWTSLPIRYAEKLIEKFGHLEPNLDKINNGSTSRTKQERARKVLDTLLPDHRGYKFSLPWIAKIVENASSSSSSTPPSVVVSPDRTPSSSALPPSSSSSSDLSQEIDEADLGDEEVSIVKNIMGLVSSMSAQKRRVKEAEDQISGIKTKELELALREKELTDSRDNWIKMQKVKELEIAEKEKEVAMLRDTLIATQSFMTNDLKRRWSEDPDVRKRLKQEMEPDMRAEVTASIRQTMNKEINQQFEQAKRDAANEQCQQAKKDATEIERLNKEIDRLCREKAVLEGSRERDLATSNSEASARAKRDADEIDHLQKELAALKGLVNAALLDRVSEGEEITPERLLAEINSRAAIIIS